MSDKTQKFLAKLPPKQLARVLEIIARIRAGELSGLAIKPLQGHPGYFRIRVGRFRIIFRHIDSTTSKIVQVSNRDDQTYRDF